MIIDRLVSKVQGKYDRALRRVRVHTAITVVRSLRLA